MHVNLQLLLAAVVQFGGGQNFEKLLTLKLEKPLICLVGTGDQQHP
jgi:hypothetical protein